VSQAVTWSSPAPPEIVAPAVSGVPANGYALVTLAGSYDLGNGLPAYARINNLFDRRYQDPIGFQRPGFGIFAGVRIAFDTARPVP
jgi:vitamin B12 transporter